LASESWIHPAAGERPADDRRQAAIIVKRRIIRHAAAYVPGYAARGTEMQFRFFP
jgi:hypothetical protein